MGFLFADAQETDISDIWQNAALLNPNGDPKGNTFSFYKDMDWYKFYAEEGVTYKIFTHNEKDLVEEYNHLDILIYLYSDPTKDYYIAQNMDIENDGNALIEWFCPDSETYFVMVKALNPYIFGDGDAYTIQITGKKYPQDAYNIIPDVPDYSQSDFGNKWDCKAVAAACILGYWDAHGYGLLVDSSPERIEDITKLVYELHEAMMYSVQISPDKRFTDENVREGIEFFCNTPRYGNNYNFKIEYIVLPSFLQVTEEINNNMPVLFGVVGHPIWDNHWMATVGYLKTDNNEWTINHDNWGTTHRDIYVDWDETAESIITICPGKDNDPEPLYIDFYPKIQYAPYPMVLPWLEPFPAFSLGMISPFTAINDVSVPSRLSSLNTGYSNQFDPGGSGWNVWPYNPELYNGQRSMAGSMQSVSFSTYNYDNSNFYNLDVYNYTPEYKNIIPNPLQESYSTTNFGLYPFSAKESNALFDYPSSSVPQMFIPSLAISQSLGPFLFPSLSPPGLLSPFLSLGLFPFLSLGLSNGPFLM